jgi:hypothetical protein
MITEEKVPQQKATPGRTLSPRLETCNNRDHAQLISELEPGKSTRCPFCRKALVSAPIWKCVHGSVDFACSLCAEHISYEDAELTRLLLLKERSERGG